MSKIDEWAEEIRRAVDGDHMGFRPDAAKRREIIARALAQAYSGGLMEAWAERRPTNEDVVALVNATAWRHAIEEALGLEPDAANHTPEWALDVVRGARELGNRGPQPPRARRREDYQEVDGEVLWWRFPIAEPPYCGSPLNDDFPDHVTHWTPLALPEEPNGGG